MSDYKTPATSFQTVFARCSSCLLSLKRSTLVARIAPVTPVAPAPVSGSDIKTRFSFTKLSKFEDIDLRIRLALFEMYKSKFRSGYTELRIRTPTQEKSMLLVGFDTVIRELEVSVILKNKEAYGDIQIIDGKHYHSPDKDTIIMLEELRSGGEKIIFVTEAKITMEAHIRKVLQLFRIVNPTVWCLDRPYFRDL